MSPFFSSLVIRTLGYAWTSGVRFSHSLTDNKRCTFCNDGPEKLPHIISCPQLLIPLLHAINEELETRNVNYRVPPFSNDPSILLPLLIPPSPSSHAHLLLLACACDLFHSTKLLHFRSSEARASFIRGRVQIIGEKIWEQSGNSFTLTFLVPTPSLAGGGVVACGLGLPLFSCPLAPPTCESPSAGGVV